MGYDQYSTASTRRRRFAFLRSRLAIVIVGLALGFAARWISDMLAESQTQPNFEPMPAVAAPSDDAEPPSDDP